jgi:tRNA1Val (adenine37-N6)-methyltransferase
MANAFFHFKQFTVWQEAVAMKVTTDGCLFGAWCAHELQKQGFQGNLLDIGTGTGLLSLMVAQQVDACIESIDIEKDAILQAEKNFSASPWAERLQLKLMDVFEMGPERKWDAIIANPPFYSDDLKGLNSKKNVAHHSTYFSLNRFMLKVSEWLKPEGHLFLLIPQKRHEELEQLLVGAGLSILKKVEVHQSPAHSAFRFMYQIAIGIRSKIEKSSIIIKDSDNHYSELFISLLKPYYLKL